MGNLRAWHPFKKQRPKGSQSVLPKITINYTFNNKLSCSNTFVFVKKQIFSEGSRNYLEVHPTVPPGNNRSLPLWHKGICHIITMLFSDNWHSGAAHNPIGVHLVLPAFPTAREMHHKLSKCSGREQRQDGCLRRGLEMTGAL